MDHTAVLEAPDIVLDSSHEAAIMDGMDDLFDDAADGLAGMTMPSLPPPPLPASILSRAASAQRSGCCTKLAWSNTGSIAQIAKDGGKITFRTMARDPRTGVYGLSGESKHVVYAPEGRVFVHVQFSGLGLELAVFDNQGGVHLYALAGSIGRMQLAPCDPAISNEGTGDLHAVMGVHWLPLYPAECRSPYITPATKYDSRWITQMRSPDQQTPRVHHPADNRGALLYVTRSCALSLLFQSETGVWHSLKVQLETWTSAENLLSHAALGDDGDHLVLATHDRSRRLRLYKVGIHWNSSQQSRNGMQYITVAPTLEVSHMTAVEHVAPQLSNLANLSHLRIIPRVPEIAEQDSLSVLTVLAVFTHLPGSVGATQQHQDMFSVIARWTIGSTVPTLHESFTKIKPSGVTPAQNAVTTLSRQPDEISGKLVLTVDVQYHNTLVAFAASDGTIEFRDRSSWATIEYLGDTTIVSSLPQSGLGHFAGENCAQVACNTDGSAIAIIKTDGSLAIKHMTVLNGWQPLDDGITDNGSLIATAVICLARQYTILCSCNTSSDEVLALLPPDLDPALRVQLITQIIRTMCKFLDISMLDSHKQQRAALGDSFVPRAMSAQLALGTHPWSASRTFAGQYAYNFLNLKLLSYALAQSLARETVATARSDVLASLTGLAKWGCDFMIYVIQSLSTLHRHTSPNTPLTETFSHLATTTGNPALALLLSSFPRVLFKMQGISIPQYLKSVHAALPRARSLSERHQLQTLYDYAKSLPVPFPALHDFLHDVDAAVRNAYTTAGTPAERRAEIEVALMTEGRVAAELEPALQTLFTALLPRLAESADMGKVYFWDTRWLGIETSVPAAPGAKRYDAVRKTPLPKGGKVRVCRRCGAQMEDLVPEQARLLPPWLQSAQRHCFCQSYWWLE